MFALFAGVDVVMEHGGEEGQRAPASVGTSATSRVSRGTLPISAHDKPLLQCRQEDYEPFQRGRFRSFATNAASRACRGSYGSICTAACAELPTLDYYCRNVRRQLKSDGVMAEDASRAVTFWDEIRWGFASIKVQANNNDRNSGQAKNHSLATLHQATGRKLAARKSAYRDE